MAAPQAETEPGIHSKPTRDQKNIHTQHCAQVFTAAKTRKQPEALPGWINEGPSRQQSVGHREAQSMDTRKDTGKAWKCCAKGKKPGIKERTWPDFRSCESQNR